ncbi:3-hydroxyacyl-CoA dehydrogenase [Macrococcus armenti]|uniref:6-phosphogluconate dehydrogenase, decarboxylating n=2 Tax=Macrococcus armenti TaxID=2875764 RepID=A0ABY3ZXG5_9STAP|nr:3-hydroxyacyl-CoA dehydrogenase [Macrococcus armenti]UOB21553.1 3-hydroxyacyl-CoA dehydrogenase [Macrococcus armenti]
MMFKNITIAGGGVLGSQIAFQTAYFGYEVKLYDINEDAVKAADEKLDKLVARYTEFFGDQSKAESARKRISTTVNLEDALQDSDLLIEAVPEKKEIKVDFYTQVAKVAPEKTIFATNSSTMVPSDFAEYTGRPEKFLALHFANEVWKNNTGEVMGHAGTDKKYEEEVLKFAESIGLIPLHVLKETPGYILNSILVPFLEAGKKLYISGVADIETIDKTWMAATGMNMGPFGALDVIGLNTDYHITLANAEKNDDELLLKFANLMKEEYIDKGNLGVSTGKGFYTYPNPSFKSEDFIVRLGQEK